MPKLDLNRLAKKVQKSAGDIAKTVSDAASKLPDVKAENVSDTVKDVSSRGQAVLSSMVSRGKEALSRRSEKSEEKVPETENEIVLSPSDALRIIYGLMSIDGNISPEEEDKFALIGKELDPRFDEYKDDLIQGCRAVAANAADPQDHYDLIHEHILEIIKSAVPDYASGIRGKLLLWDLFAIAYSDNHYDETEKRLIRFVSRALHIDQVIAMEMEQALQTMMAIEAEEEWLRTTNRQYRKVEERMNELSDRKQAVMQGIQALIMD